MMQNAPINKFWGPLFDYFVDITIFMIWGGAGGTGIGGGSVDDDDDDPPGYPLPPIPTRAGKKDVVRLDPH